MNTITNPEIIKALSDYESGKTKGVQMSLEELGQFVQQDIKASTTEYKSLWKDGFHTLDKRILESKDDV